VKRLFLEFIHDRKGFLYFPPIWLVLDSCRILLFSVATGVDFITLLKNKCVFHLKLSRYCTYLNNYIVYNLSFLCRTHWIKNSFGFERFSCYFFVTICDYYVWIRYKHSFLYKHRAYTTCHLIFIYISQYSVSVYVVAETW